MEIHIINRNSGFFDGTKLFHESLYHKHRSYLLAQDKEGILRDDISTHTCDRKVALSSMGQDTLAKSAHILLEDLAWLCRMGSIKVHENKFCMAYKIQYDKNHCIDEHHNPEFSCRPINIYVCLMDRGFF